MGTNDATVLGEPPRAAASERAPRDRPKLAPNVRLVGEFQGSGFAERQWLIERQGQFVQVSDLLYRLAEQLDGRRTVDEIADALTTVTDWAVTPEDVRHLIDAKLIPMRLVAADGAVPTAVVDSREATRSPLAVNLRTKTIGPRVLDPVTAALQYLFAPAITVAVLAATVLAEVWLYRSGALFDAFVDALYTPGFLLIAFGLVLLGAGVHELGHASALRYGGGRARAIGAGFYLVFPVFYTDVTDSYRLGRWGRVRTGLGGVYFHLIFILALVGAALALDQRFLLVAVVLINLEIVRQFIPFVRLDGYWVLTDLTGIPDFFSQMEPFVRSLLPERAKGVRLPPLKPWAKAVFLTYICLLIPALGFLLFLLAKSAPRIASVLWDALVTHTNILAAAWSEGDALTAATSLVQIAILGISGLGTAYILFGLVWKLLRAPVRQPTPARRALALVGAAAIAAVLVLLWGPHLPFAGTRTPLGVQTFEVPDRQHVKAPVVYPQLPPVGGNHAATWQNCGFYATPIRNEHAVHSLEHGAVWVTYRPDLASRQIEALRELAQGRPYLLVSPLANLPTEVVASAWGHQLRLGSAYDERLRGFINRFEAGDTAPEPGGPCTGGTDTPR
jgi:putative peptide zinc metalloprotease protein